MRRLLIVSTRACRAPSARQTGHTHATQACVVCAATASTGTTLVDRRRRWPMAWHRPWA